MNIIFFCLCNIFVKYVYRINNSYSPTIEEGWQETGLLRRTKFFPSTNYICISSSLPTRMAFHFSELGSSVLSILDYRPLQLVDSDRFRLFPNCTSLAIGSHSSGASIIVGFALDRNRLGFNIVR